MIDRRQCVTGLTAAAILPALPAFAQADAPIRLVRASMVLRNAPDAHWIALVSRWQYEEPAFHQITIRHIDTGLAFAFSLRAPPESEAYRDIAAVQWDAPRVACHACRRLASRPLHRGTVFFHCRSDADPAQPFFRPPLPPADLFGFATGWFSRDCPLPVYFDDPRLPLP
jgi:hypothetical protein